jgi:DUF1680 family protein
MRRFRPGQKKSFYSMNQIMLHRYLPHLSRLASLLALLLIAPFAASGSGPGQPVIEARGVRETFPLGAVKLLDGPFKRAKEKDLSYLLSLEPDRLLHWHRKTAGLPPKADPYGGWEKGGSNILGHYLTACALMYATTHDQRLRERVNYLVAELAQCQQNRPDGALFNGPGMDEMFEKMRRGIFEYKVIGPEFPLVNGGNPWYGLHKVFAGLRDAYRYTGNALAKAVLVRYTDWAAGFADAVSEADFQAMLDVEHGGMCEVIADVYALTGAPKHLALARKFVHQAVVEPLAAGRDMLYPHHANNQIPKFVGYARLYGLVGPEAQAAGTSAFNFWELVRRHHTLAIGGNSEYERFGPAGRLSERIGYSSAETCNTYNMLKLSGELYRQTGAVKYMHYYERALWNHILASLGPQEGAFCYYVSLQPGHFKTFSTPHHSNWCCVGSGMENPAKYEESIYAHDGKQVFVNLYLPSELTWKEKKFGLRQQTRFPESDTVRFTITEPGAGPLALRLRIPEWVHGKVQLLVNDRPFIPRDTSGAYATLQRKWKRGDVVTAVFPMRLHLEPTPDNPSIAAILYGPVVLAGELGKAGMEGVSQYQEDMWRNVHASPLPDIPFFVGSREQPGEWIKPAPEGGLAFRAQPADGAGEVTLRPFYQVSDQRYSVYWDIFSPAEWQGYGQRKKEWVRDEVRAADSLAEVAARPGGKGHLAGQPLQPPLPRGQSGRLVQLPAAGRERRAALPAVHVLGRGLGNRPPGQGGPVRGGRQDRQPRLHRNAPPNPLLRSHVSLSCATHAGQSAGKRAF